MEQTVTLAMIGVGKWAQKLADAIGEHDGADIVTAFARSEDARVEFASRNSCGASDSLEELLARDDVDGVVIATPHSTHAAIIERAAEAGKHVFVEKPLTLSVDDAERAIAAAEKAGVVLQVGHHRRRQPATRAIRALIDDGELGTVSLLEANLSGDNGLHPRAGWRSDPREIPLGSMTGKGVHMADNLVYLAGTPRTVSTMSRQTLGLTPLDDVTIVGIEFASGALGYFGTSQVIPNVASTVAYGSGGAAWSEEDGSRLFRQAIDARVRMETDVDGPDALVAQMAEYVSCIRDGASPEVDGRQAREVVAILEGAMLSRQRGRLVDLDELR